MFTLMIEFEYDDVNDDDVTITFYCSPWESCLIFSHAPLNSFLIVTLTYQFVKDNVTLISGFLPLTLVNICNDNF